jgi:hypothetical protein
MNKYIFFELSITDKTKNFKITFFFKGTALGNSGSKTDPGLTLEKENLW